VSAATVETSVVRKEAPVLPPAPRPIGDDEAARLFAPFADLMASGLVLAVSGGSDSMGLMHLAARWADGVAHGVRLRPRITVVTIDHALRADSRADAAFVCEAANALGLPVTCLRWDGPKPRTGLSEAAREARYALLTEAMRDVGARLLMTAHTADDQAETLLMRLARGSGIDGLAGMAPLRPLARLDGAHLARPLLGLEKARLRAHLAACGVAWREDPTNVDPDYERPRLRAARDALAALGLATAPLALSARRLRRAADALDATAREAFTGPGVRVDPCGLVQINRPTLLSFPTEIGLRVLRRAIEIAGGAAAPIPLASLEDVLADLDTGRTAGRTLARAALHVKGDVVSVEREPGRAPLPRMALTEGARVLWDGRFEIEVDRCAPGMEAGPLGADGLAALKAQGLTRPKLPVRTLRALPAIWRGADLVAVPLLGASHEPALQLDVRTILRGSGRKAAQAQAAS
jgi:tRNA(Ile)-lysidine synthase